MVRPSKGRRLAPAPDSALSFFWLVGWLVGPAHHFGPEDGENIFNLKRLLDFVYRPLKVNEE
jgi:hypothetical protein